MPRGKYVVIEGHDGTGKSTQVALLRKTLGKHGIESIEFHEPEGTPIAKAIRSIILNGELPRDPITNLLLFTAARHEIWRQAQAALSRGTWVIAARNYFSTLAYQGYGEGIDLDLIIKTTQQFTDQTYMSPDIAVILTLEDEAKRAERIDQRGELAAPDTFESRDEQFQRRVQEGYLKIAKEHHLPLISAIKTPEAIAKEIYILIEPRRPRPFSE